MNTFLVPIGDDRYRFYCEVPLEAAVREEGGPVPAPSWWRVPVDRFRQMLAAAEEDRRRRERGEVIESSGAWRWLMRKVADAIAEQRLLWTLRTVDEAALVHPSDLSATSALDIARTALRRDAAKHRRSLVINGVLTLLCVPLIPLPGPNLPGLYFSFRTVGHYLSFRGARNGASRVSWQPRASAELSGIREALRLPPAERGVRVEAIAAALGLERLGQFIERVTE